MTNTLLRLAAPAILLTMTSPAIAQNASSPPPATVDQGADRITIGIGPALVPSYTGSDQYILVPGIAVQGQVSGIAFDTAGRRSMSMRSWAMAARDGSRNSARSSPRA